MTKRWPKGYVGRNHETIGSDVVAVLRAIQFMRDAKSGPSAEEMLGAEEVRKLSAIDPNGWYPIGWMLDLMATLDREVGRYGLRKMGRALFQLSHEERIKQHVTSARQLLDGMDAMYHHANRGEEIGGWRTLSFTSNDAELEKTTPHMCALEEGIISEALRVIGAPASVGQSECFLNGALACRFVIVRSGAGNWE